MSGFRRTSSGLNNQHLFYNVDIIVFVEGGSISYNKTEVIDQNKYNAETEDIIFWNSVFKKLAPNKKIKFKSVGSKTTIKEIAVDITNGIINTVFIAMDNEFDELLKQRIQHNNIFYTHGYSWENDVWNSLVIKSVIEELTAIEINGDEIEQNFDKFLKAIKSAVNADAYLFKRNSSFFPRKSGHLFCVNCVPVDLPEIKKNEIENKLTAKGVKKSTVDAFGRRNAIDVLKFCYGHFLADYCYQLVFHYIKKRHSLTTVSKDIIFRMGIKKFFDLCFNNGHIHEYYRKQFSMKTI